LFGFTNDGRQMILSKDKFEEVCEKSNKFKNKKIH